MRDTMKKLMVVGLSIATVATSMVPAMAAPVPQAPKALEAPIEGAMDGTVDVQYYDRYYDRRDGWRRGPPPRHWRDRGPPPRYWDGGRRHGGGWYRGHRGYRDYRPGYRQHDGYWFPLAAFATGAILGGAMAQPPRETYRPRPVAPPPVYRGNQGQAHVNWCAQRYKSYDYRSNTFQPYHGPRQTCYSPYS